MVHSCPHQWSKWISVAEFWYNTAHHSVLGRSPFEVLYGQSPRHLGIANLQLCSVPDLEQWMKERELMTRLIQQHLQSSIAERSNKKLSFRYYGPFRVLQRIGEVAYKLDLPATSRIHPVLHVSQLKRRIPKEVTVTTDLTSVCTEPEKLLKPEKILKTRLIERGTSTVKQALVRWTSLPDHMATWEDEVDVLRKNGGSLPT